MHGDNDLRATRDRRPCVVQLRSEGLHLRMLHADIGTEVEVGGTILFMDKEPAIKLAKNKVFY